MSELREADDAVTQRQEAISDALSQATGLNKLDVYRHLFIGMDLSVPEILELAEEHSEASMICAIEDDGPIVLNDYVSAAWLDGFSVAAMLFMRRREAR